MILLTVVVERAPARVDVVRKKLVCHAQAIAGPTTYYVRARKQVLVLKREPTIDKFNFFMVLSLLFVCLLDRM
jgi:hypothetical protein